MQRRKINQTNNSNNRRDYHFCDNPSEFLERRFFEKLFCSSPFSCLRSFQELAQGTAGLGDGADSAAGAYAVFFLEYLHKMADSWQPEAVAPQKLRLGEQLLRGALGLYLPFREEVAVIAQQRHHIHVVGGQEDGDVETIPNFPENLHDAAHALGVQAGGGLVQDDDLRLHGQHTGDGHPLFLAVGEGMGGLVL